MFNSHVFALFNLEKSNKVESFSNFVFMDFEIAAFDSHFVHIFYDFSPKLNPVKCRGSLGPYV